MTKVLFPEGLTTIGEGAFSNCSSLVSVVLPETVSSLGNSIFSGCDNLTTLYYMGLEKFPNVAGFDVCDALTTLCVPPDYQPLSFLGCNVTNDNPDCQSFQNMFNHCFLPKFLDEVFVQSQRRNASEWKNRTYTCVTFECDDLNGALAWGECNSSSSENVTFLCVSDLQCLRKDRMNRNISVEIDLARGVSVSSMSSKNVTDSLIRLCDIPDAANMTVAWENDDYVTDIVVYVDDPKAANDIAVAVEDLDKGKDCEHGVLCRAVEVRLIGADRQLDAAQNVHETIAKSLLIVLFVVFIEATARL